MQSIKDWRFALMWGLAGVFAAVVLHLLPEPFHVPFNGGFSAGWVTITLIMWILARFRSRR